MLFIPIPAIEIFLFAEFPFLFVKACNIRSEYRVQKTGYSFQA